MHFQRHLESSVYDSMNNSMYQQNIIDHYRNPRNKGTLKNADKKCNENNLTCGDSIVLQLKFDDDKIVDAKFLGSGCAISQASVSMLTEKLKGMPIKDAKKLDKDFIFKLLGVPISSARHNCALLSLKVLHMCIA